MTRINRVLEHMAKLQVDSVIIKDVTTIRYLTGFTGDSSLLYLDRQQGVLITDGRYTEQARNEMKFFKVLEYTPAGAHSIWATAADLAKNAQAQVVGFDGAYYSYDDYTVLHELLGETYMHSIDFSDMSEAIPCYVCIIAMPFFYSISEGISMGIITYVAINLITGKAKEKKISALMYVLAVLFILKYIFL